jgi:hypothetical protein
MIHELRGIKETLLLSETNTRNAVALRGPHTGRLPAVNYAGFLG